jgi:hypothetical protein
MTAITIQGPILALDPATRSTLLQSVVDSLPIIPTASDAERTAQREAAFALLEKLAPTDPVEAMLAFQIVAAQYACANAYRCAARPDLPPAMHLSYQSKAATLSRLTSSKRRELMRHQASQPTLPAGVDAARELQARAAARAASARPAAPAPQPKAAAQRPATPAPTAAPPGHAARPDHAAIDRLLANAAAASHPAHDDARPTDAEPAQIVANALALLAEIAPPAQDTGAQRHAEVAARATAATQLAA